MFEQIAEKLANAEQRLEKQFPEWIPVLERLPENESYYLATYYGNWDGIIRDHELYFGDPDGCGTMEWYLDEDCKELINGNVVAWMPLPEPYKEDSI